MLRELEVGRARVEQPVEPKGKSGQQYRERQGAPAERRLAADAGQESGEGERAEDEHAQKGNVLSVKSRVHRWA